MNPALRQCCLAVGLLWDGACSKGIGGTFYALGASWWGVGSGLMKRVHLAESWGLLSSLVQSWFIDQRDNPFYTQSLSPPTPSPPWSPQSVSVVQLSVWQSAKSSQCNTPHPRSNVCLEGPVPLPIPTTNPQSSIVGFSDSLALFSQVKQPADSFQPSSSTQPVAPAAKW